MVIMWWLYLMYYCIRIQTKTKSVRFCGFTPGLGSERDGFHLVISSVWKRCTTSQGNLWGPRMGLGLLGMPQVSFPWLRADWSCLGIPRTSRQCTFGRIPGFRCSFLISEKSAFQRDRRHLLTLHLRIWCISQVMQRLNRNSPGSVKPKPQIPFSCKAVALRAVNCQLSSVTVVSEWFDSKINEGLDEGLVATFLSWKRVEAWEEPLASILHLLSSSTSTTKEW